MRLHLSQLPKFLAERRSSAIFGIIIIAILWAGVFLKFSQDEREDLAEAERTSKSFALVFEENVLRSIEELDNMLFYARRDIEMSKEPRDYNRILHSTELPHDIVVQMAIIDANGTMRASTAGPQPAPPTDLSDRDHFTAQRDSKDDRLYISKPVIGRASGKWSIQLSRRFLNSNGTFGGVVVASLDPDHLTQFYNKIDLTYPAAIALIGSDGFVRAAGGAYNSLGMGEDIRSRVLFDRMQKRVNSTFEMPDDSTGRAELIAIRKIQGHPLWVSVGFDRNDVLVSTFKDLRLYAVAASVLTLIIFAAMEMMFRAEAAAQQKSAELQDAFKTMARLASEDSLTCLLNLRGFRSALAVVQEKYGKIPKIGEAGRVDYGILLLDLDRFKVINDTLGHNIGDLLLQETAKRLQSALRESDIVARLGGDEFGIIVEGIKSKNALEDLAGALIKSMRAPFNLNGYRVLTTVSVGVAVGPSDGEKTDDLVVAADLALYAAKEKSRDSYQFYQASMTKELTDRRHIEIELREAIERNGLELYYQPIVSLDDDKVTGFEALARWNHPIKGPIPPAAFIPIAEDTGLMASLGEWALMEACARISRLPSNLNLAVNLSPVQFSAPDLVDMVQRALLLSGLPPHRLELEITERLVLENSEQTLTTLRRLHELGVRIALDDFGTGYSALSYLRSFPLDRIKIDRSFISDLATQSGQVAVVQAVVSIARSLGMSVTAEGVETAAQKEFLRALGCDAAQGFLFGEAVSFEKLIVMMADGKIAKTAA